MTDREKTAGARAEAYGWIGSAVAALIICVTVFSFFGRMIEVFGVSMLNTLSEGDRLVVSDLFYTPERGDIIVFHTDASPRLPLVKRVIATGGETVAIDFSTGQVYIDGEPLPEDYTAVPAFDPEDFTGAVTVPEGCVFVMGDNRNSSTDSRDARIGFVDVRSIIGKAYFTVFPFRSADGL